MNVFVHPDLNDDWYWVENKTNATSINTPKLSIFYIRECFVYSNNLFLVVPPKAKLCIAIRLLVLIMNIKSGGKSWRMLLIDSKLAKSRSLKYFLYSSVIGSPILLVLLIVLSKNMIGRYSMCLWILSLRAYYFTFLPLD